MGKTSTSAKARWNRDNYLRLSVNIRREDGERFKEECEKYGFTTSDILRQSVYDFLGEPVPETKAKNKRD